MTDLVRKVDKTEKFSNGEIAWKAGVTCLTTGMKLIISDTWNPYHDQLLQKSNESYIRRLSADKLFCLQKCSKSS